MIKDIKGEWGYFRYDMEGIWSGERTLISCIINVFMTLSFSLPYIPGFILASGKKFISPTK